MTGLEVSIVQLKQQTIYGVKKISNDKTIARDIKILSQMYRTAASTEENVFPCFVLSKDYDEQSQSFELLIGSTAEMDGSETFILPAGEYAKITVRPKWGFLWGAVIGKAKRYFYTEWLPRSPYKALNMEYEYHTEKSTAKQPAIDLIFAVEKK